MVRRSTPWLVWLLLGCTHSDAFPNPAPALPAAMEGSVVQLTYNTDQDYWPAWTQDGRGILYAFVISGSTASHRCLGILPAAGGTRSWQLCDNRGIRADTVSSFTAFALDSTGRLLLVEAVSHVGSAASFPFHIRLLLTDTAAPYVRTLLDTIPERGIDLGGDVTVSWLSDLQWTGPNTFVGLGQQFGSLPVAGGNCGGLPCIDSTFAQNGVVVTGTITGQKATLAAVLGTDLAQAYSLAENGTSVVFSVGPTLYRVPIGGGVPTRVGANFSAVVLGVTCRGETCLVAVGRQVLSVSLTSGISVGRFTTSALVATPILSPISNDVVVQVDGLAGHQGSNSTSPTSANLFLYKSAFQ